jgi:hypothetical protein
LKKHKSPGSAQIVSDIFQAGGELLLFAIHKLINYICNKEELPDQWKDSTIAPIHKKDDTTEFNN